MQSLGSERTNCHKCQVTSLPLAQLTGFPLLRVPRSSYMDSDVMRHDMAIREDIAILRVNDEGTSDR
jgi:hypothetical protein